MLILHMIRVKVNNWDITSDQQVKQAFKKCMKTLLLSKLVVVFCNVISY